MDLQFDVGFMNNRNENVSEQTMPNYVDVVIVGAGPAGLSAGIYAQRKGLKTIVIGSSIGGQVNDTSSVENYPGFSSISGEALSHMFYDHAISLDLSVIKDTKVIEISNQGKAKLVVLEKGNAIRAKTVVIATGSTHRTLGVKGENRLAGKGVVYCAICDGPLFQDREVIVAGGGNSAVEAAIDLSKIAKKVSLVHRSLLRADQILIDRMNDLDNIDVYLETQILEVLGENRVKGVRVKNKNTQVERDIQADGVFVEVGYTPNTSLVNGFVEMNDRGEILTDTKMQTNVPGIFAAGDVVEGHYKQIVIAAGDGAKAALSASEYINYLSNEEELINEIA